MTLFSELSDPVRFGDFQFCRRSGRLTRQGRAIALSGQPLAMLRLFLKKPGVLITRPDLHRELWPSVTRIDTSRRLNTAMRALRTALHDTAAKPRYIETVRGQGYRFIARLQYRTTNRLVAGFVGFALVALLAGDRPIDHGMDRPADLDIYVRAVAGYQSGYPLPGNLQQHLVSFVERHPGHGPASKLLVQLTVDRWRQNPRHDTLSEATAEVDQLLFEQGTDPDVLVLRGEISLYGHWDWPGAEIHLTQALALAPDHTRAHHLLAWLHVTRGDPEKAWPHVHELLSQTPLAPGIKADIGWLLLRLDQASLALSLCSRLDDSLARINTLSCRHTAQARLGDIKAANETAIQLMGEAGADPDHVVLAKNADPFIGYGMFLDWRVKAFTDASWFQRAQLLADAGELEAADDALQLAFEHREPHAVKLISSREFDPLRNSESYQSILNALLL